MAIKLPKMTGVSGLDINNGLFKALNLPSLSTALGTDTSKNDRAAQNAIDRAVAEFGNIDTPELAKFNPEAYAYGGDVDAGADLTYANIDPRLADLASLGDSALSGITTDPRLRNEQMAALDALNAISEGGGMTAADRANLNKIQNEVAQADRGRRDAILQNAQARGMAGGGQSLLAQLQSSQAATDRANQSGLDIAGMAQQRALDAIMQSGTLAGNLRNQDYGQQAELAAAQDAIAKFNAQNANSMAQFNTNAMNTAAANNAANQYNAAANNRATNLAANQYNAANRQNVANANVDSRNQAQQANNQLGQQNFDNRVTLAQGASGQLANKAGFETDTANRKAQKEAAIIGGVLNAGASLAGGK